MRSDGTLADLLYRPAGGATMPFSRRGARRRSQFVKMAGREVFKHAVRSMAEACDRALDAREAHRRRHRSADSAPGEHPHHRGDGEAREHPDGQGLRERRPLRQHVVGVDSDRARRGDRERARQARASTVLLVAFGAGFTWGSMVVRLLTRHGRRTAVSRPGLAEARHGEGPRRRVSRRARRVRRAPTTRSARRSARSASRARPTS